MNYKHLLYFWAVAKHGGASSRRRSTCMSRRKPSVARFQLLEEHFGRELFQKVAVLELTDAGQLAFVTPKTSSHWGQELIRWCASPGVSRVRQSCAWVLPDAVPKMVACHLLEACFDRRTSLQGRVPEWKLDSLLVELAGPSHRPGVSDTPCRLA